MDCRRGSASHIGGLGRSAYYNCEASVLRGRDRPHDWIDDCGHLARIAKRLIHAVENMTSELSVKTLRLDTNAALPEALKLYRMSGWIEINRFNEDPHARPFV